MEYPYDKSVEDDVIRYVVGRAFTEGKNSIETSAALLLSSIHSLGAVQGNKLPQMLRALADYAEIYSTGSEPDLPPIVSKLTREMVRNFNAKRSN